jgi:hypothetical protein
VEKSKRGKARQQVAQTSATADNTTMEEERKTELMDEINPPYSGRERSEERRWMDKE